MNHPKSLQAGARIDDYEIEATLWTTNSGFIYRAGALDKKRHVLIQEYLPPAFATRHWSGIHAMALEDLEDEFEQGLSRFLREARVLAQINDPYVCRVYEYTEANATAYMVLDYEPGRTLSEHLGARKKTPLTETELRELLVPLLKGLRVAHGSELLHRDIHPANIYLRDVGPPVLIGFGSPAVILRGDNEPHVDNRVAPGYTPVEQYQNDGEIGPWSDLYALGATLYRCLSGATPVDAPRRVTHIAQDKDDPLTPAMELGAGDYSAALLSAIDWMLEPMASDRPESASAVLGPLAEKPGASRQADPRVASARRKTRGKKGPTGNRAGKQTKNSYRDHSQRRAPAARSPAARSDTVPAAAAVAGGLHHPGQTTRPPGPRYWGLPALLVIAGLMLVAAFLLFGSGPSPRPDLASQAMEQSELPVPIPADAYPPPEIPDEVNFGHARDDERADEYRNLQREIEQTERALNAARVHLEQGRLVAPAGNNALESYRAVLALNPDHGDALRGIEAIQRELLESAESAFGENDIDKARRLLERAADIREETTAIAGLRQRLEAHVAEQQRQAAQARAEARQLAARIESLSARAEAAVRDERLTQPPQDNALAYYRQLLRLDPGNAAATQGLEQIGRRYLDRASDALANERLDEAGELLDTASGLLPDNDTIALLRRQLATRQALAASRDEGDEGTATESTELSAGETTEAADPAAITDPAPTADPIPATAPTATAAPAPALNPDLPAGGEVEEPEVLERLQRGVTAYYDGDYAAAFRLLNSLAERGQPRAKFRVAMMYYHGRGLDPDPQLARNLIREALPGIQERAEQGVAWAQADIAALYADGIVLAEDNGEAIRLYTQAAEQGYAGAQTNLGVMYANGEGVPPSREKAIAWLRRAAAQGDHIARNNLKALGAQ